MSDYFDYKEANIHNMDDILDKLSKRFSQEEKWAINLPAAKVFEKSLKATVAAGNHVRPIRNPDYKPDRKDLLKSIDYNKEHGGAVTVGVTRKSKKAYIARFLNDGWTPSNQFGGPYMPPVEPEHFWERAMDDSGQAVKETELRALKEVLKKRGL